MNPYTLGHLFAVGAFGFWGFIPLFWKEIGHLSALVLLGHRILWALLSLLLYLLFIKRNPLTILKTLKDSKMTFFSTALISLNWFIFVYAVQAEKMVECSLGYFLNPLLNVLLGIFLFNEKLGRGKAISLALAFIGVILFSIGRTGSLWISFGLAFSFALYGAVHKRSPLKGIEGLFCELCLLSIFLLPFLFFFEGFSPSKIFDPKGHLVFLTGPVTLLPLLLFTGAVKRIPYTNVGLIQYLAPIGQFSLGVFLYQEPFNQTSFFAFILIWSSLILFSVTELFKLKYKNKLTVND